MKDGGQAFPEINTRYQSENNIHGQPKYANTYTTGGMTLRDYFAGQALTGLILNEVEIDFDDAKGAVAKMSYRISDAMLKAREETNE